MLMHNPPHPGRIVKRMLIDGAGLNVTEAARVLGVGRVTISNLIHEHIGISLQMAMRLSIALDTSSKMWLNMQNSYDLWQLRKSERTLSKQVTRIKDFPSHREAI